MELDRSSTRHYRPGHCSDSRDRIPHDNPEQDNEQEQIFTVQRWGYSGSHQLYRDRLDLQTMHTNCEIVGYQSPWQV